MEGKTVSCDFLFTNNGPPIPNAFLTFDSEGTVIDFGTHSAVKEIDEHYSGGICPGWVNAHCHLELSYLKDLIPPHTGLVEFLKAIPQLRKKPEAKKIQQADRQMFESGCSAVGDVCNTLLSLDTKKSSKIFYHNFVELLGMALFPENAESSVNAGKEIARQYEEEDFDFSLSPHAPYTSSIPHLQMINGIAEERHSPISIHFLESPYEDAFLLDGAGPFLDLYKSYGLEMEDFPYPKSRSIDFVLDNLNGNYPLVLVHNVHISLAEMRMAEAKRPNLWWCTCPKANLYIQNKLPDYSSWLKADLNVLVGTDSLASNDTLSMIEELKTIHAAEPLIPSSELIRWATLNGARFLSLDDSLGLIEKGKQPGLVHLSDLTIDGEFSPASESRRII